MKILLIEDQASLQEVMRRALEQEGYVVESATDFQSALSKTSDYEYDCVLLDIMLPGGNGLRVLEHLKNLKKQASVIIISAKDALEDKIEGLELGADDYLAKPFHIAELSARIRSVLRRRYQQGEPTITLGNVKVAPDKKQVWIANTPLVLGRKEYDILLYFLNRPNHLIQKEVLAESVWGDNIDQVDNFDFIYAQIKNVRKKMAEAGASLEIKAVYGFGYKLVEIA